MEEILLDEKTSFLSFFLLTNIMIPFKKYFFISSEKFFKSPGSLIVPSNFKENFLRTRIRNYLNNFKSEGLDLKANFIKSIQLLLFLCLAFFIKFICF